MTSDNMAGYLPLFELLVAYNWAIYRVKVKLALNGQGAAE